MLAATLIASSVCGIPSSAAGFYSYIYDEDGEAIAAPDAVTPGTSISGTDLKVGSFNSPQDLFTDGETLYIADTKNNRIVVTDFSGEKTGVISEFTYNGKKDKFKEPEGICVTGNDIYVADTGNSRVVKLDKDNNCTLIISSPSDDSFSDDFVFTPTKMGVDSYGRIFVISEGYNMGLMQFDTDGTYLKSIGAPKVTLSVIEQFWRKFSTKAQRERSQSVVPTEYSNVYVADEGFIYVTNESTSEDIEALRMLNSKGNDILKRIGDPSGDILTGGITYKDNSSIIDFCELEHGNFAILDRKRSRVFVYNEQSELLYVFGGPGTYNGGISVASSMVYCNGKFYITDSGRNTVAVYELNEYGRLFNSVAEARENIDYEAEEKCWNEILSKNLNCTLAMNGLGSAAYKRHDMKTAMKYYKMADNKTDYSKAYSFVRREWIESNIVIIVAGVALIIAAVTVLGRLKKKYLSTAGADSFVSRLDFVKYVCFHPLKGFWELKREKRGSKLMSVILLAAAVIVMTASNLFTGFIFNNNNLQTYNMFGMAAVLTAAVLIWCIAQWCVTSLMNGEGKFGDIFVATCTSLWPYITVNIISILLSRVLLSAEGDFYYVLTAAALIWTLALIAVSVMQTHNFTAGQTVLAIVIVLVVILLMVFIGMLAVALSQQLVAFVKDIITEVILRI